MKTQQVTLWYRLNKEENWLFNHLEDGWIYGDRPLGASQDQCDNWSNGTWFSSFGLKGEDGKVYQDKDILRGI